MNTRFAIGCLALGLTGILAVACEETPTSSTKKKSSTATVKPTDAPGSSPAPTATPTRPPTSGGDLGGGIKD